MVLYNSSATAALLMLTLIVCSLAIFLHQVARMRSIDVFRHRAEVLGNSELVERARALQRAMSSCAVGTLVVLVFWAWLGHIAFSQSAAYLQLNLPGRAVVWVPPDHSGVAQSFDRFAGAASASFSEGQARDY